MINIGITGGETVAAGELVRLLINHPDVAIKWIFSNHEHGAISNFHKGLLGECDLKIQDSIDEGDEDVDIIFC
jgi:N-acetyl-gamma-glutamyl-phosphate reductase